MRDKNANALLLIGVLAARQVAAKQCVAFVVTRFLFAGVINGRRARNALVDTLLAARLEAAMQRIK